MAIFQPGPGEGTQVPLPARIPEDLSAKASQVLLALKAAAIPGIPECWTWTVGDPEICIAVLDGPVDLSHPSLAGANLALVDSGFDDLHGGGVRFEHGTHVASVIFGRHGGPVPGIAPGCRGVLIPIYRTDAAGELSPCSQLDLARALTVAVEQGAKIVNVSGGQFSPSGRAHPLLENVVRDCVRSGVLIVAAAGNQGCECLHIPAALDAVLAVGAMNAAREPLPFSNWGGAYAEQGLLAPGENIIGAQAGGGIAARTGTSYATAIVSGVVALLLSVERKLGRQPDPLRIRAALLETALGCDSQRTYVVPPLGGSSSSAPPPKGGTTSTDCRRLLAGRLNIQGALANLTQSKGTMTETTVIQEPAAVPETRASDAAPASYSPSLSAPSATAPTAATLIGPSDASSACSCKAAGAAPQLIFALGEIGYDLVSEARLDSLVQKMADKAAGGAPERGLALHEPRMLAYLDKNPWDAAAVEWTLSVDGTPIYAIRPQGPFAADAYKELRAFLKSRVEEKAERVSIPGVLAGKAVLLNTQVVPVIVPDLRGMYSWTTGALVDAVVGRGRGARQAQKKEGVRNFLDRVYHAVRNLGQRPQDRALNFAATNAFEIEQVYESAMKEDMDLDSIHVEPSPICRPGSDCWDVQLYFFYPARQVQTVRKVYRFTVDVSDVVPVTVGEKRSWFTR